MVRPYMGYVIRILYETKKTPSIAWGETTNLDNLLIN